jgi:hypothetical protein
MWTCQQMNYVYYRVLIKPQSICGHIFAVWLCRQAWISVYSCISIKRHGQERNQKDGCHTYEWWTLNICNVRATRKLQQHLFWTRSDGFDRWTYRSLVSTVISSCLLWWRHSGTNVLSEVIAGSSPGVAWPRIHVQRIPFYLDSPWCIVFDVTYLLCVSQYVATCAVGGTLSLVVLDFMFSVRYVLNLLSGSGLCWA